MDYVKMMYAVEVQKLAEAMRQNALAAEKRANQHYNDHSHWIARNPVISFVPAAIAQLNEIAAMISDS